jgi:hypothetical protein
MANRILHPANQITVAGCNGFAASVFRWGIYGKAIWAQLSSCYTVGTSIAGGNNGSQSQQGNPMTKASADGRLPLKISEHERVEQLEQTIRQVLGYALEPSQFAALVKIQTRLWHSDHELDQSLERKKIGHVEYLNRMDSAMVQAMEDSRALLGPILFGRIFGDAGDHPQGSIDHDAFLAHYT